MKRSVTSITIAISSLTLLSLGIIFYIGTGSVPTAQAKHDSQNCSLSSMKGSYGYTLTGFFSPSPGFNVPLAAVGTATIDEGGSISNNDTLVVNGVVTENRIYSGTIALNSGNPCTGKVTYSNGLKDNFVVVDDGEELQVIQTAPESPATLLQSVVTGAAKRQSPRDHD
jgi:hypothetical protein